MTTVGFTGELKGFKGECANIGVHRKEFTEDTFLISMSYEAILRCMKETNRKAFYTAMAQFIDDAEYNDMCEFIEGMCGNE